MRVSGRERGDGLDGLDGMGDGLDGMGDGLDGLDGLDAELENCF